MATHPMGELHVENSNDPTKYLRVNLPVKQHLLDKNYLTETSDTDISFKKFIIQMKREN